MILALLLLDVFFYNYTSISTCFFLLIFLKKGNSIFFLVLFGLLFDFFILHTYGIFTILLLALYYFNNKMKGTFISSKNQIVHFFLLTFFFLVITYFCFHNCTVYFFGILLNFICLLGANFFS